MLDAGLGVLQKERNGAAAAARKVIGASPFPKDLPALRLALRPKRNHSPTPFISKPTPKVEEVEDEDATEVGEVVVPNSDREVALRKDNF